MNVLRTLCIGRLLVCLSLHLPGAASAQPPQKEAAAGIAGKVTLDFKEIELADLIQTISEMTGRNFIFDDTVDTTAIKVATANAGVVGCFGLDGVIDGDALD